MGRKDDNYQIVYRNENLEYFRDGQWVFFQRSKESGGGFWLGRTYPFCFMLEFHKPTSLFEGLSYILTADNVASQSHIFDDDFELKSD